MKMKLENFQGVRSFAFEPDGRDCDIYGTNGSGKSTVANAFSWLLYGKPSTAEKNFTPQTVGTHGLSHAAEAELELDDGSRVTLRKDYHEVYKTKRGSNDKVLSGHTVDYFIDGVPKGEGEYGKALESMCGWVDIVKMLTSTTYFLETMAVKDRRKILLDVCGDVGFGEVVASNPELAALNEVLKKPGDTGVRYTVEEYQAVAAAKRKKIDQELKALPGRLDEAEKAKPDLSGKDEASVRSELEKLEGRKKEIELRLAEGAGNAGAAIAKEIAEAETELAVAASEHQKAETERERDVLQRLRELKIQAVEAEDEAELHRKKEKEFRDEISELTQMRERLRNDYTEAFNEKWDEGNAVCPTCGRPLPEDKVEELKAKFNREKAEKLENIRERGLKFSKEKIEEHGAFAEREAALAVKAEETAASLKAQIDELSGRVSQDGKGRPFSETDRYKTLSARTAELRQKLADVRSGFNDANAPLKAELKEAEGKIRELNETLSDFQTAKRQDGRIRELEGRQTELAGQFEDLERGLFMCESFVRAKASMLTDAINGKFETLKFRLFTEQQNGGIKDDCEAMIPCADGPVPFKSANTAARVNAGLEVIDALSAHYGKSLPLFIDGAESVVDYRKTGTQLVRLYVSEKDGKLRCEYRD